MLAMLISVAEQPTLRPRRRLLERYGCLIADQAASHLTPPDNLEVQKKLRELQDTIQVQVSPGSDVPEKRTGLLANGEKVRQDL
jgi:hypothetical protein